MVQGLLSHLEQVEARQNLFTGQLGGMNLAPVAVDLTCEENKGGSVV